MLDLISGPHGAGMRDALATCGQDVALYINVLDRLGISTRFSADERAEVAMVLFIAAGCTANVHRAVECALEFSQSVQGGKLATPATASPISVAFAKEEVRSGRVMPSLQLLRVKDGCVVGAPHWIEPTGEGVEIGALTLEDGSITDVGRGVSGRHARIWYDELQAGWFVEGLDSRNGTVVVSGATREVIMVEPPRDEREGFEPHPVPLRSGDELILADDTIFIVLEGIRPA